MADLDRLLELIKQMKLAYFELIDAFPRPFFDRLAEIGSPFIRSVCFNGANLSNEPGALDFLLRMTELQDATVQNCSLSLTESLDLLIAATERINSLKIFSFDLGHHFCFTLI